MARFSVTRCSSYTIFIFVCTFILFLTTIPSNNIDKTPTYSKSRVFPQSGNEATIQNVKWKIEKLETKNVIGDVATLEETDGKLIYSDFGYSNGLGNQMFQLASLISIAENEHAKVLLPEYIGLRRAFSLQNHPNIQFINNQTQLSLINKLQDYKVTVKDCCSYRNFSDVFSEDRKIMEIDGYFQNFRYFHPFKKSFIKSLFVFIDPVKQLATEFLENISVSMRVRSAKKVSTNVADDDQVFLSDDDDSYSSSMIIGVHIRHGMDISMNSRNRKHGHVEAPIEYYRRAIEQLTNIHTSVAFLICSDDMLWARRHLKLPKETPHYFCPGPREVDMAILASCDSLIMSTGTFGWWSAYININPSPSVYYYKHWPTEGTPMHKMLNKTEYFLPSWVALE